jgi:hypothetical protein
VTGGNGELRAQTRCHPDAVLVRYAAIEGAENREGIDLSEWKAAPGLVLVLQWP